MDHSPDPNNHKNIDKKVIGRLEKVDFPEWELEDIDAKIDTGAYTSSLHCHHIEKVESGDGDKVRFNLLDPSHSDYNDKLFELPIHKEKSVKSSNGRIQERFVVQTLIKIFDEVFPVELSLTDRSEMRYPVLLGRKLLKKRFMVDVSKKYITVKRQKGNK